MPNIEKIIKELIALDPDFGQYEEDLRGIITRIVREKPSVRLDESFRVRLKSELMAKARQAGGSGERKPSFLARHFSLKKLSYAAAGAVIAAVVIIPLYSYFTQPEKETRDYSAKISKISDQAFGPLSSLGADSLSQGTEATGRGGGGQNSSTSAVGMPSPSGGFKFTYSGELDLAGLDNEVLKRVMDFEDSQLYKDYFARLNLGLIDLGSFANTKASVITLRQSGDFGYEININLSRGTISLAEVWEYWYKDRAVAEEIAPLGQEDLLAESEIINIAENFIKEHGISKQGYGQPELMAGYQDYYLNTPEYIPESISLVYPLVINNKFVYNTMGEKTGLTVNVNLREKRVSSLSFLATKQYQSSVYDLENDKDKILKLAEQGGIYPQFFGEQNVTEYNLTEPDQGYLLFEQENEELLTPALVFPVQNQESYQKNVVVPLVSGLVSEVIGYPEAVEPGQAGTGETIFLETKEE